MAFQYSRRPSARWSSGLVVGLVILGYLVGASGAPDAGAVALAGPASASPAEHLTALAKLGRAYQKTFGPQLAGGLSGGRLLVTLGNMDDAELEALAAAAKAGTGTAPRPQQAQPGFANDINEPADFATREAGSTQSETSVGWCGSSAVVGFNDSGSLVATGLLGASPSGSFSFNGWAQSPNTGASYIDRGVLLPDPLPAGVVFRDLLGDPVIGCTSPQNFYYATLMMDTTDVTTAAGSTAIGVFRSTDGGATFSPPVVAARETNFTHLFQKPWLAVDPGPTAAPSDDVLHVVYTDLAGTGEPPCPSDLGIAINYVRSTDGGQTWSAPLLMDEVCSADGTNQGAQVDFSRDSDIYVAWERYPTPRQNPRTIFVRHSTDGGASFAPAVPAAPVTALGVGLLGTRQLQGAFDTFVDLQGMAVDRSNGPRRGTVYLTFQSGRDGQRDDPLGSCDNTETYCFGDAFVTTSTDGGANWSSQVKINPDDQAAPVDQYQPTVEVDSTGAAWALWYDRRRDSRNFLIDAFLGRSVDGGATWTNTQATQVNFPPIPGIEDAFVSIVYMGDYISVAADSTGQNRGVIASWGDNSLGDPNVAQRKFT